MKVLITGAAGFIGSHLAEKLSLFGYEVWGIDNYSSYYSPSLKKANTNLLNQKDVQVINGDLRDPKLYQNLPLNFQFIFHLAAHPGNDINSSYDDYFSNNLDATKLLTDFAQKNKVLKHFFYISTSSVYGLNATYSEEQVPQPISWYGISKLAAEQLVLSKARNNSFNASSLRLYSVYGPRERPDKLFSKLIHCSINHLPFTLYHGSEKHIRSFTYIDDITQGIYQALKNFSKVNGEIINLGCEEEFSTREGISLVENITGKKIELIDLPARPGDQLHTRAITNKAALLLDYKPVTSLKDGVKYQLDWYISESRDSEALRPNAIEQGD
ncbi:nucleoside-diphosphate-sugar epimerase [Salegentibacter sp. 24]|uniref:NAD-dependent epimerase/dehydratase family protein n=1 Tax=Salegentibacter sp. 24 TaxID=2183986 RepID=UPI0010618ABA|nr:NAD-dependent epimerase/dehydratase family protein [Salegentibacter sp. 24]TDN94958.1 nucleoside-diphosphate-sugar epimerase [Salegentibacter sp. 24]